MEDIDLFDAIELIEQEEEQIGFKEGEVARRKEQFKTSFILGWQQACHIQEELGKIEGKI